MAMMPTVVITPVVMPVMPAVPMAEVADAARTVIGPDDVAAPIRIVVVAVVIGSIEAPMVEEVPVRPERESAMAKAAAVENMTAAEATAVEEPAAASTEMHAMTTAAVEAAMTTAAAVTAAAMASAHVSDQSVGHRFRGRRRAWTDRRQRVCALDRGRRQDEYRRSGEAQATDKPAPGIWNLGHSSTPFTLGVESPGACNGPAPAR